MIEELKDVSRLLMEQVLIPAQGDRFQPTGFADLGAAVYERNDGRRMLLVESAQSVANRMEAACLDGSGPEISPDLTGLPYVRATLSGESGAVTTSLVEAHRINSPFIVTNEGFQAKLVSEAEYAKGRPLNWKKIAQAIFRVDPNSILHGVFMANIGDGRVRLPRAISGFIEASDVREASSGGVKNNPLDPTGKLRAVNYDKDVYSNVPYPRTEYTAREIKAYFNLDLALLRGYGLHEAATGLLTVLALYKVRRFLNAGLRLRTACDFMVSGDLKATQPAQFVVPAERELLAAVKAKILECAELKLFADPSVTVLTTEVKWKKEEKPPVQK
jgi:CRISPR-associated protein Csb1